MSATEAKPSPMGEEIISPCVADLRWLTEGGWKMTISWVGRGKWEASGTHKWRGRGIATMGNVVGVGIDDAIHKARAWAEKWERQERQRLAMMER